MLYSTSCLFNIIICCVVANRHRDPNMHWTSEKGVPKAKQGAGKLKKNRWKQRNECCIAVWNPSSYTVECWTISTRIRKKKTGGRRNVVLQKATENPLTGRVSNKDALRKMAAERTVIVKISKTAEIPWIHDEGRELGKHNTHDRGGNHQDT